MKIHDVDANAGDTVTVKIEIINQDAFVGFNLDIPLPGEFDYIAESEKLYRDDGHSFSFSVVGENTVRMMAYSIASNLFSGNEGVVVTFDVATQEVPGAYPLEVINAVLAGVEGNNILTGTINGTVVLEGQDDPVTIVKVHDASGLAGVPLAIEVEVINADAFVGFNADFPFSGNYRYVEESCEVFRSGDPLFAMGNIEEGLIRMIGVSQSNTSFEGNEGILVRFEVIPPLKEGTFPIPIDNVIFANANAQEIDIDLIPGTMTLDLVVYTVVFDIINQQGEEITQATISFGGYENQPGDYVFDNVPPTRFDFLVQAEGYYDYLGEFEVVDGDVDVEVVMTPDGTSITETVPADMLLFPNPASREIHVVSEDAIIKELQVFDMLGKIVYDSGVGGHYYTINVSQFTTGAYILRASTATGVQIRRFQVSH